MKNRSKEIVSNDNWATDPFFKDEVYRIMNIDFDPCPFMHDIEKWDGLKVPWGLSNWVNPPYSGELKERFVNKAIEEMSSRKTSTFLTPVCTDTALWWDTIEPNISFVSNIRGRLKFKGINTKGQYVNWGNDVDGGEMIDFTEPKSGNVKQIKKYIKAAGQQPLMLFVFGWITNEQKRELSQLCANYNKTK